ncbi:MAG: hypothetical protein AAFR77_06710, partial [Cyanobacteria bacterium J06631_2]
NVIIFATAIKWGALGVAAAYGVSRIIIVIPAILYCYGGTWLKWTDFVSTIFLPAFASILAAFGVWGLRYSYLAKIELSLGVSLALTCLAYILFYGLIWLLIPQGRNRYREIWQIAQEYQKK